MNFNYLLPGGGKGSRIFGGDHMVFRGTRGGGQSSLTEYEGRTFRKLKANGGIIRTLQSVWGGETGKFFYSKKFPSIIEHHAKFCCFLHTLSL